MTENNRLDCAMSAFNALSQLGTDLERLFAAMTSLDGILLTGASDPILQAIEDLGLHYNAICKNYSPDAFHPDRVSFNATDAADLVARMRNTIEVIRDGETERILSRLRHHHGKLPEAEIIEVRRHRDLFIPILMREFRDEIDKVQRHLDRHDRSTYDEHNSVPFFAFYLFSEWDTVESIPVVFECLKLSDDGPFDLLSDGLHEQLSHYLAQFLSHDLDQIDAIICDPKLNMFVRWSAVTSYHYLVRDQNITLEDSIARLEKNFHATKVIGADGRPGESHCYEVSAAILVMLQKMGSSMQNILSDSQNWNFIESSIFHPDYAKPLSESDVQKELRRLSPTRIPDCLECLRHWAAFESPAPKPALKSAILNSESPSRSPMPSIPSSGHIQESPSRSVSGTLRQEERTPRNAKCPCGSGKKYKQCCLRR